MICLWMPRPHSDTTIPGRVGRSSTAVCWSGRPHGTFTPARISGRRPPCLCLGLDGSIIVAASVIALHPTAGCLWSSWIALTMACGLFGWYVSHGSHRALSCALPCCLCVDGNAGNVLCLPDIQLSKSIGEKFPSPLIRRRAGSGNLCFEIFFQNYDESKIYFLGHIMLFMSVLLFVFCLRLWMYQATYPKKALRKVPLTFNPQKMAFW